MLRAEGVSLRRGGSTLVDAVDLALEPGRLTVLLGPNGAGKSSLAALLSGATTPSAGRVTLDDQPLADWPADALARRRAVLRQNSDLSFAFTVREVVELGRSPHRGHATRHQDDACIARAMALVDIAGLRRRLYPTLSGGERQRVQAARVLAQVMGAEEGLDGRCLLLDEPTASLDLRHQLDLLAAARDLAAKGCAVLAVLHDLPQAARFADRVLVMEHGRLVADGPPRQTLTPELVQAVFGVAMLWIEGPANHWLVPAG